MNSERLTKTSDEKLFVVNIVEEFVRKTVRQAMCQERCACCQVFLALGAHAIPDTLYPNMHNVAKKHRKSSKKVDKR